MSELRWHPVLGEWVITATHRNERTFLPPDNFCPLCPTKPGEFATEVDRPEYELVVFENRFPSLRSDPGDPAIEGTEFAPVRPSQGVCEVVLYSQEHNSTLSDMPVRHIKRLIRVWQDRYIDLGSRPYIEYVYIFENKGKEIGVTLTHPHGQIYAYPFVPPRMVTRRSNLASHMAASGDCLLCEIVEHELEDGRRLVAENDSFVAFVPFYARYPYEVHIIPTRHDLDLDRITPDEISSFARMLRLVLLKYDALWGFSLPYIMNLFPRPTDGLDNSFWHFAVEFYPPYRTPSKLKYLAGSESGVGAFINDTLPEDTAAQLRAIEVDPDA